MSERERYRAPPPPEPPPHRVRAADLYPRPRTHYDEPGLSVGFTPICGEFVQWVGRTADGGTIAMSNYRLHAQPRRRSGPGASVPLRVIDAVEIRDLVHLIVLCKHGRQLKCTFNNGDNCMEWWRRLNSALPPMGTVQETFAAAYAAWAKEQPPASLHKAFMEASLAPQQHWFAPEVERLEFTAKGAWRVSAANADYKLCPSYPPLLIVPATIGDEELDSVARFRAMRRIPAVVWRHRGNGAVIARSSQPEVGWLGWRSSEDERLLAAFVTACNADRALQPSNTNKQMKLLIVDARSYTSAVTNRARGGGCECAQYYPAADIQFMSLPNIHHVRRSFQQVRALVAETTDSVSWYGNVERTLWLQYVSGVCRAACVVARGVLAGRAALVHCSDGWDRTPQIVAAAQLILDPYYRTIQGFRVLIEREWLDYGHKFADRCGHNFGPEDPNERSPIFLQWLDLVHQMMKQYPCSFQFNEAYLIKLATHVHSCMFGTFLCNTTRERIEMRVHDTTAQVWELLNAPAYRNHLYSSQHTEQVLWPDHHVRSMHVWWSMFVGEREEPDDDSDESDVTRVRHYSPNGLMTKTRSCDNLLNDGERRTAQRRCSGPSLAPDVMKLSTIVTGGEIEGRRECRSTLTDSCVDALPALPSHSHQHSAGTEQVDGLHPDHFESSRLSHDIASGSSSLERELGGPVETIDKVIDHTLEEHTLPSELTNTLTPDDVCGPSNIAATVTSQVGQHVVRINDINVSGMGDMTECDDGKLDTSPDGTPDDPVVFVSDNYGEVIGLPEGARESNRSRHISITWRSISESSNQSLTGFELGDGSQNRSNDAVTTEPRSTSHESSPEDNHNSTEGDAANHNVVNELTNHNRENGAANGMDAMRAKFLEVELSGGATSSSIGSESEVDGEMATHSRRSARPRVASQLTLCPTSPRRLVCGCHCIKHSSHTSGIETSGDSGGGSVRDAYWCGACAAGGGAGGGANVQCVCGGWSAGGADPLDGLPPAADPLQARLHQIIIHQRKMVDNLTNKLRYTRDLLRQATASPTQSQTQRTQPPTAPSPAQVASESSAGGSGSRSGSNSGSSSSSASEVEVGEEARGVVWLPDSAAPRCQNCRNHFWLARRRHHCGRCGGIFCSSCSEMSKWGEGSVRVCRRCHLHR